MVTTASTKVTMITSTHNLQMSLRWKVLPFLLSRRDKLDCELAEFMTCLLSVKPYRIIFRPLRSVLKRVQQRTKNNKEYQALGFTHPKKLQEVSICTCR